MKYFTSSIPNYKSLKFYGTLNFKSDTHRKFDIPKNPSDL